MALQAKPWLAVHRRLFASTSKASSEGRHAVLLSEFPEGVAASTTLWLHSLAPHSVADAARAALGTLIQALGGCPPSLVCASLSPSRDASSQVLAALRQHLDKGLGPGPPQVPIAGCSSVPWHPHASAYVNRRQGGVPSVGDVPHLCLAAVHLPGHEVHAFHCASGSLPHIPHLSEALSTRPPQFLVMGCDEQQVADLTARFEGLFGESSVLASVTAATALPPRRVGMLVQDGLPGMRMFTMPVTPLTPAAQPTPTDPTTLTDSTVQPPGLRHRAQQQGPFVFLGDQVHTAGCTGFILYPKPQAINSQPPTVDSTAASTTQGSSAAQPFTPTTSPQGLDRPQAPIGSEQGRSAQLSAVNLLGIDTGLGGRSNSRVSAATALLISRSLFGWPRFASLRLSDAAMPYLQPPHTALQPPTTEENGWLDVSNWPGGSSDSPAWPALRPCAEPPMHVAHVTGPAWPTHVAAAWPDVAKSDPAVTLPKAGDGPPVELLHPPPLTQLLPRERAVPTHLIPQLPVFMMAHRFTLCPGGRVQVRVFEARYQWLVRQALSQGAAWGFTLGTGLGVLAAVRRYYLCGDQFYCDVEVGQRFLYSPQRAVALPGTFGLVAADAQIVQDHELGGECTPDQAAALLDEAVKVVALLHPLVARERGEQASKKETADDFETAMMGLNNNLGFTGMTVTLGPILPLTESDIEGLRVTGRLQDGSDESDQSDTESDESDTDSHESETVAVQEARSGSETETMDSAGRQQGREGGGEEEDVREMSGVATPPPPPAPPPPPPAVLSEGPLEVRVATAVRLSMVLANLVAETKTRLRQRLYWQDGPPCMLLPQNLTLTPMAAVSSNNTPSSSRTGGDTNPAILLGPFEPLGGDLAEQWFTSFSAQARLHSIHDRLQRYPNVAHVVASAIEEAIRAEETQQQLQQQPQQQQQQETQGQQTQEHSGKGGQDAFLSQFFS